MPGILIIGYGNILRGDDAVGFLAARELERQYRDDPEVEVIACQQLTPEMADDISRSELIVFLDAASAGQAGTIQCKQIVPENGPGGFTHHLTPASLIGAAEQLYGEVPNAFSITLSGWSFELGNKLSAGAQQRLPEFIRKAAEIVATRRKHLPSRAGLAIPTGRERS